jgi:hypothetical protein
MAGESAVNTNLDARGRSGTDVGVAVTDSHPERTLVDRWARTGAACGVLAMTIYTVASAASLTIKQEAVVAAVFGPAIAAASMGLYHVLRLRQRTVSLDLGLVANLAAGVTVTLMLMAQLGLKGWFELEFGDGAADSSERPLRAAFEAANGVQLGLDVAWDVFIGLGTVLLALNMWSHPRFGRILAVSGASIAIGLIVINLAIFPEPPGHSGVIDLGPLIGVWYVIVSVRLARSGRWIASRVADK